MFEAKKNLYKAHPLAKGQAFANVTVDFKRLYVLCYMKTTALISADIVDFNMPVDDKYFEETNKIINPFVVTIPNADDSNFVSIYVPKIFSKEKNSVLITIFEIPYYGKITSYSTEEATVEYVNKNNTKTRTLKLKNIYTINKSKNNNDVYGFDIGEKVKFGKFYPNSELYHIGEIIAINKDNLYLKFTVNNKIMYLIKAQSEVVKVQ